MPAPISWGTIGSGKGEPCSIASTLFIAAPMSGAVSMRVPSKSKAIALSIHCPPSRRRSRRAAGRSHHAPLACEGFFSSLDEAQDHGCEDELHSKVHLAARAHDRVRTRHERTVQHRQQIREIDALRSCEPDDQERFVGCRDEPGDEWVRRVDDWDTL